jgi:hypothetical protein
VLAAGASVKLFPVTVLFHVKVLAPFAMRVPVLSGQTETLLTAMVGCEITFTAIVLLVVQLYESLLLSVYI